MQPLYPLRFTPIFRRYVWGGRKLGTLLGKQIGQGNDYAESWELVDRGEDQSRVADGPLAGTTLGDLGADRGQELVRPPSSAIAISAVVQVSRLRKNALRASASQRRTGGTAHSARFRQGRSVGGAGRRGEQFDLRRAETRLRSARTGARSPSRHVRTLFASPGTETRRLPVFARRRGSCIGSGACDCRNSASQRRHVSIVRLESAGRRRQTAAAARESGARGDRL